MENMKNLEGQNLIKDLIDTMDWRSRAWPSISFDLDLDADLPLPLNCSIRFQTYRVIEVYDEPKQKVCLGSPGTELEFLLIGKTNKFALEQEKKISAKYICMVFLVLMSGFQKMSMVTTMSIIKKMFVAFKKSQTL